MKKKNLTLSDFNNAIVWSYTRVSTKDQFVNNGSIETQVNRIKAFAKANNLIITQEFDAEYESSKRLNTQSTLGELMDKIKKTHASKRPKMILIWSPSRFGRAGAEHIQLFVSLRKEFNVYLYSVSTDNHTFNERAENEFSTQLLYAQKENFSRQDTIIPGLINSLENGKVFGRSPKGYDHYGPRVADPTKVQAYQEIKINAEGKFIKEAFKMKIYKSCTDVEIMQWLSSKGVKISKQRISEIWRNQFYTGRISNSLLNGKLVKGTWEPMITAREFNQLQRILSRSNQLGIAKISGKETTPLAPKFLICSDCNDTMTSYLNKAKNIHYYKCNCCNKTINASTSQKSLNTGIHDLFNEVLDGFSFSDDIKDLFSAQLKKIINDEMSNTSETKKNLSRELNELKTNYDNMEYRYAINEISKDIFDRQGQKIKETIDQKMKELENVPSKKSNHEKAINFFVKIAENPSKFYTSLDYSKKRRFQSLLFPKGFQYSIKNRKYRTSKTSALFELTNSISKHYNNEKEKTHPQKVAGSRLVAGTGLEPVTFGL
ncbi:recombinase family protein [Flavobacterium alvei]|uniref:recombinase family protein n=1 Tax=Flavobacterium alvei TaxID=2080416 RepID=UPI0026F00871|nr:recombinase family protein [Flavobacterium alvei]